MYYHTSLNLDSSGADKSDRHTNKEIAFFHKSDRALINADLVFNLPSFEQYSRTGLNPEVGVYAKLAGYFLGTKAGKGQQRFNWYATSKDKSSFSESAKIVAGWDIEKIIPCHGDVIESDGKEVFKRLFAWHL